ncbi:MAG: Xylose activator XylR (AraC family) [uncultured Caballeronia sp.]|nr:MAG: Xylose activator XylR (AraC family) [uncultured Caballeronia sp.]
MHQEILNHKLDVAKQLLARHDLSSAEVAIRCGFTSLQYMYAVFRRELDCTPREYQERLPVAPCAQPGRSLLFMNLADMPTPIRPGSARVSVERWGELPGGDVACLFTLRKGMQRAECESHIITAARVIAEREGWNAVTIRRLAEEIEYSQPVLYSHFENKDAIVAAVAVEGFQEITVALREAARGSTGQGNAIENVAMAYLGFAFRRPALYEAMFILPTDLRFAEAETRPELRAAFEALATVVTPFCVDVDVVPRLFGQSFMGSPNSNVQAESGPARALNVSCLLFGHSSFPETAFLTPAHRSRPAARGGEPAALPSRAKLGSRRHAGLSF